MISPSLCVAKASIEKSPKRFTVINRFSFSLKIPVSGALNLSSRTNQLSDVWNDGAFLGERKLRRYQNPGI